MHSPILSKVRKLPLPNHVALIMDGNGRWAKSRGLPRTEGHRQGALAAERLVRFVREEHLFPYLTLFAFSTENWSRPREEVDFLFRLLTNFIQDKINDLVKNGVRLRVLGAVDELPSFLRQAVVQAMEKTVANNDLHLTVALNFGGRWAILMGVQRAIQATCEGCLSPDALTAESFRQFLPTAELPDPDLIIRTGGHKRLSNFFLWEAAYSELYFTDKLWPDFEEEDLLFAIADFQGRSRNFGRASQ